MNAEIRDRLTAAGADPDSAIARFMGNESMYQKFALKFLDDKNYETLVNALESGDAKSAFEAAHTLKGVAGNLSFQALGEAVSELVEPLRAGDLEGAREKLPEFTRCYEEIVEILREWKA